MAGFSVRQVALFGLMVWGVTVLPRLGESAQSWTDGTSIHDSRKFAGVGDTSPFATGNERSARRLFPANWQDNAPAKIVLTDVPRGARIDINAREVRSNRAGERHFITDPVPVGEKTIIRIAIRVNGAAAKIAVEVEGGKRTRQAVN